MTLSEEDAKELLKLRQDLNIAAAFTSTMTLEAISEDSDGGTNLTLQEVLGIQSGIDKERLIFQQILAKMDNMLSQLAILERGQKLPPQTPLE